MNAPRHQCITRVLRLAPVALLAAGATAALAQGADSTRTRWISTALLLGDPARDNERSALLRDSTGMLSLFRSPSSMTPGFGDSVGAIRFGFVGPAVYFIHNSAVPYSINDGALWAGRGANASVIAGARAEWRGLRLFLLPEWTHAQNEDFDITIPAIFPARPVTRNAWSSPFHTGSQSIDLPIRFGDGALTMLAWGQSALFATRGFVSAGIASENNWWGPGIRNALILSNNAGGFPHVFFRSARPIPTAIGSVEARWIAGGLSASDFFDDTPGDDYRSIALLGITLQPKGVSGLTVGAARSVYSPAKNWGSSAIRFFDVFRNVGSPDAVPFGDTTHAPGPDQLFSLFGRWVFPAEGIEIYGEWGRAELPRSLRDLLTEPNNTQGYTLGTQWLGDTIGGSGVRIRAQAEATFVEQSTTYRFRPIGSWYASHSVPQGYTYRGQPLGAAIGPGSSSQWLAFDAVKTTWTAGAYVSRIRWLEDARSQVFEGALPLGNGWCEHDVSLLTGLRGTLANRFGTFSADYSTGWRYNLFFQHAANSCPFNRGTDKRANSLSLTVTPSLLRW